jgi:hypothetical protein
MSWALHVAAAPTLQQPMNTSVSRMIMAANVQFSGGALT